MSRLLAIVVLGCSSTDPAATSVDSGTDSEARPAPPPSADAGDGGGLPPPTTCGGNAAWGKLTVATVIDPAAHGGLGNGTANDLPALEAAIAALPTKGGIIWFGPGKTYRKTATLAITKPHVKLWSANRGGGIFGAVQGVRRRQAVLCRAEGCGVFGLAMGSDATERFDAAEDNQITVDHVRGAEVVGTEISNSAAVGIFLYGSQGSYIEGNWIHHTWADHIHHTDGARRSWVWGNTIFNELPSKGDDGIACVTYGVNSPKCGDMEWWSNTILGSGWGRGYSVIGGDHINIHDNWSIGSAGAGIIVASEGSYNSASSSDIVVKNNYVYRSAQVIGHPGILISGENAGAPPLDKLTLVDNVSAETVNGQAYRAEGKLGLVNNTGLSDSAAKLPRPIPVRADAKARDTSILATRDTSWVDTEAARRGLHRIHVRNGASGFEQRFEYVVRGAPADLANFQEGCTVETRIVGGKAYALVVSPSPLSAPPSLEGVTFEQLRAGDADGTLAWLWQRIDAQRY